MSITIKRVYEKPERKEGLRILVDRLWPRGLSKTEARIDVWLKEVAPSNELRRWYQHDSRKWPEFKKRYSAELDKNAESVNELVSYIEAGDVVFLYSSREVQLNNAVALKEYLDLILGC